MLFSPLLLSLLSEKPWFHSGSQSVLCYHLFYLSPCCLSPHKLHSFSQSFTILLGFFLCLGRFSALSPYLSVSLLSLWRFDPDILYIYLFIYLAGKFYAIFICSLQEERWSDGVCVCVCLHFKGGPRWWRSKYKDDVVMALELMNLHTVMGNIWQADCCS